MSGRYTVAREAILARSKRSLTVHEAAVALLRALAIECHIVRPRATLHTFNVVDIVAQYASVVSTYHQVALGLIVSNFTLYHLTVVKIYGLIFLILLCPDTMRKNKHYHYQKLSLLHFIFVYIF